MNPSGASSRQDVAHPALVEERPDRAQDLLEVLARAARRRCASTPPPARLPRDDVRPSAAGRLVDQASLARDALERAKDHHAAECKHDRGHAQGGQDHRRRRNAPAGSGGDAQASPAGHLPATTW